MRPSVPYTSERRALVQAASGISAAMQEACAGGGAAAVTAVCGSKGTGKSTFGRLLLNSLLNACNQVAWLETDCGQPEFTVPGQPFFPAEGALNCCYGCAHHYGGTVQFAAPCELYGYTTIEFTVREEHIGPSSLK